MIRTKLIKCRSGVSLIYVMLVLVVMSILSVAIFTLFASNIAQAKQQEYGVKAHFLALSGVEVAFAALIQDNQSLLKTHFGTPTDTSPKTPLEHTLVLSGEGEVDITVETYMENLIKYIRITSVGKPIGSSITKTLIMRFRIEYPEIQSWD